MSTFTVKFATCLFHDPGRERRNWLPRNRYQQTTAPFQFDFERSWLNLDASFPGPDVQGHSWFDASFPANLHRYDKASSRINGSFHAINPTIRANSSGAHRLLGLAGPGSRLGHGRYWRLSASLPPPSACHLDRRRRIPCRHAASADIAPRLIFSASVSPVTNSMTRNFRPPDSSTP